MIAFAAHEFELGRRQPDGCSKRQHLEAAAAATGVRSPDLDGPPCPPVLTHVWQWFCDLDAERRGNGFDVTPFGFEAIYAWAALMRTQPTVFEIECLIALDREYRQRMRPVEKP